MNSKHAKILAWFDTSAKTSAFWSRVDRLADGCWLWPVMHSTGYGLLYLGSEEAFLAHRVSWTLTNGEIPAGLFVCHHCDVRACMNPAHLFLGTAKDNTQDAIRKGRWIRRGKQIPTVPHAAIRADFLKGGVSQNDLARKYGVCKASVSRAVNAHD